MTETAVLEPLPCGPAPDDHDLPHWEGLRRGALVLPSCGECGTWRPLGRVLCAACWSFATTWQEVPARGRVYTWARSHRAFMSELDVPVPYVSILVELDEAPVRLLGLLEGGSDAAAPAIGTRVAGVVRQPANAAWPVLRWRHEEETR